MALKSVILNNAYDSFSEIIGSLSRLVENGDPLYVIASSASIALHLETLISDVLPALVEELQTDDMDEIIGIFIGFLDGIFAKMNQDIAVLRNTEIDDFIWAQVRPIVQRKLHHLLYRGHVAVKKSRWWRRLLNCISRK